MDKISFFKNIVQLFLLSSIATLTAETPWLHRSLKKQTPSIVAEYTLVDLGEIDLNQGALTRQKRGASLGPSINNRGEIVINGSLGGSIYRSLDHKYSPKMNGGRFHFHDINNASEILVSTHRSPIHIAWSIWPVAEGWNEAPISINTRDQEGYKIDLIALSDTGIVAGEAHPNEKSMPIIGNQDGVLSRIAKDLYINLEGTTKALNSQGAVVGKSNASQENFPFLWSRNTLYDLFPLRKQFHCPSDSKLEFVDLLVADDDTVYGSYYLDTHFFENPAKETFIPYLLAFKWIPVAQNVELLDLDGMRFSAINKNHVLVGSLSQEAAYLKPGEQPLELALALPIEERQEWQLIEATSINDKGQIVGFGKKNNQMHLFLANPL